MKTRGWTCQRVSGGVKCGTVNPGRKRICAGCGKRRPPRKRPGHMKALDLSYEEYVRLNGGEHCGVCGRGPTNRRLDRDHDHKTGQPRGLCCPRCNRALPSWVTPEWLRAAAAYLERVLPVRQDLDDGGSENARVRETGL